MMKPLRTARTPCPLSTFSSAVYLNHSLAGLPSPTNHPLVAMACETARRIKTAGVNQKRPFLASQIRRLFELWGGPSAKLHQLMKLTAVTLCYVSFFRFDDLVAIQWQSIKFVGELHMELLIPDSKTDQNQLGETVFLARLGGPFCSVSLVCRLLEAGQYRLHGNGPLIRSTVICPPAQHIKSSAPCYLTVNAWFKEAASILGLDPKFNGTHSGKRPAARPAPPHMMFLTGCSRDTVGGAPNVPRTCTSVRNFRPGCPSPVISASRRISPLPSFKRLSAKPA
jgi:hypothetical protein